jgi:hypothetical protein
MGCNFSFFPMSPNIYQPPSAPLVPTAPKSSPRSLLTPEEPAPRQTATRSTRGAAILSVGFAVLIIGIVAGVLFMFLSPEWEQDSIRENGLPASGTIVDIRDTGNTFNDQPQVELTIDVTPPQGETYQTKLLMIISPVYLSDFHPGNKVDVKYDPEDRMKIAID